MEDFLLNVRFDGERVRPGAGGTEACGLKLDGSILEG